MEEITISIKGGAVIDVSGIPKGTRVKIIDYDIDGYSLEVLEKDRDNNDCVIDWHYFPGKET